PLRGLRSRRPQIGSAVRRERQGLVAVPRPLRARGGAERERAEQDGGEGSWRVHRPLPSLRPVSTVWPVVASTTVFAFAVGVPSRARKPSTVTTSPTFIESRFQPLRIRRFGLASSIAQFTTL